MIKIVLPAYYTIEKKTKPNTTHLMSSNWFRNAHIHSKNNAKKHYAKLVSEQLVGIEPIEGRFLTKYVYYYKNKTSDASNVISQIEKFALDAVTEKGVIGDDCVKFHVGSQGWHVAEDKENPRVEIFIFEE